MYQLQADDVQVDVNDQSNSADCQCHPSSSLSVAMIPTDTPIDYQSSPHLAILRRDQLLVEIEKEKRRRRLIQRAFQVLQVVLVVQAASGLIVAIKHYAQNEADCAYPIPTWLLVNFCLAIFVNLTMFIATCCQHISNPTEIHQQAARGFRILGFVAILGLMIWSLIGAKWAFTISSDECDSSSVRSIQVSVGISFSILGLNILLSPLCYKCYKKRQQMQMERDVILREAELAELQLGTKSLSIITA